MIRRSEFDRALASVRRTGAAQRIEELVNPLCTGRPRQLRVDVFLAAILCTVADGRPLTLVNVHSTLTATLPLSARLAFGAEYRPAPTCEHRLLSIRQVRYLLEAIERRLAFTTGRVPDLADEDRDVRKAALQHVMDEILQASFPERLPRPSDFALDGTAIESWARGKRRPASSGEESIPESAEDGGGDGDHGGADETLEELGGTGYSFDPDARWGYRTRTYDNKSSKCFGYEAYAMVGIPATGSPTDSMPKLTYGFTLRALATDVAEPGLSLVDGLTERGFPVGEVVNDRAWSYLLAERWATELRQRGISQVFDLHPADRGVRDFEGVQMVDGMPYCPAMPERLAVIERPVSLVLSEPKKRASVEAKAAHDKATRELEAFQTNIAERERYRFRLVQNAPGSAKDAGKTRWECPAQAGKVTCANCPASAFLGDVPQIENPPAQATAPRCCTQRTITIPGNVTPKLRQDLVWGSPEWIASFARRTYVEGFFGNLKMTSGGNVKRGWCRVVGLVKTSLLAVCVATATNMRLLRRWAESVGGHDDPLCAPLPEDHGFEELTEEQAAAVKRCSPPRAGPAVLAA